MEPLKKMILIGSALLIMGALVAPGFSQEEQPAQEQMSPAAPAVEAVKAIVPMKKKMVRKRRVKKVPAQRPVAQVELKAVVNQEPEPAPAPAVVTEVPQVPQVQQVEIATVAPAAVIAPVTPEPVRRSVCPNCFQPLLAGYNEIVADLKPWMDEMDVKAAALDQRLSDIQKQINEKDDSIEKAKLGTDKKEAKAAVKSLGKERKMFLKEYAAASDEKDEFYKRFSKEVEKKIEGYNKIVEAKLKMTLSAASQ